jgi:hypothetical protein
MEGKIEVARKMKSFDIPINQIAAFTGISAEDISNL